MSNKRANVTKVVKCSVCAKADRREIVPGAISFFDRCTLTANCAGRLTLDPNADVTARNQFTWTQSPIIYKVAFSKQNKVTVQHNFGHLGSIVVEVFTDTQTTNGIVRRKTSQFTAANQTKNTVDVDLYASSSGVIVVTDNQYSSSIAATASPIWTPPGLLTSNILTIASDQDTDSFDMAVNFKLMNSVNTQSTTVTFQSHLNSATPIGQTIWAQYRILAIEKPYYLYSTQLAGSVLTKGTAVQLSGVLANTGISPTIVLPMAVAAKAVATDIVQDRIIRNSTVRLGDLIVDNNQVIIANSSIIEELRKPFIIY